ncbi:MAG: Uncharacterised protein [Flavobacteriaceae bacterium]|nr:MAG: Uncharacterised protein [Flavobacteriaceae bacterium]
MPSFLILLILGVFGLMIPSENPTVASLPISSAIINKIFGLEKFVSVSPLSTPSELLSPLQATIIKVKKRYSSFFIMFVLNKYNKCKRL